MEQKQEKHSSKRIGMIIISIVGSLAILIGVSYAWFTLTLHGTKTQVIKTGSLELTLDETASEGILLDQSMPLTDEEGLKTTSYKFTLKNTGTLVSDYTLSLEEQAITGTRMPDSVVKYYFKKKNIERSPELLSELDNRILDVGHLYPGDSVSYELKVWIDYDAGNEIQGTKFNTKVKVEGSQVGQITDESCFTFDASKGAITSYSNSCPKDVIIPKKIGEVSVTYIDYHAFADAFITSVVIPNDVTRIEYQAFANCSLKNVEIPSSVLEIGYEAFSNNPLTTLTLSDGVKQIDPLAFKSCELTSVEIPSSVTEIGQEAFAGNYALAKLVLSEGIKTIRTGAFQYNNLTNVTIPSSVTSIAEDVFSFGKLTSVVIKGKSKAADFDYYGSNEISPFNNAWASGYSDSNITWQP